MLVEIIIKKRIYFLFVPVVAINYTKSKYTYSPYVKGSSAKSNFVESIARNHEMDKNERQKRQTKTHLMITRPKKVSSGILFPKNFQGQVLS